MTTKVGLSACALAYACALGGCYWGDDGNGDPPPDPCAVEGECGAIDAGVVDSERDSGSMRKDASRIDDDDASSSSGGSAGSSSGPCDPGGACNGLYTCTDECYGAQCCRLSCTCTDPTGQSGTEQCSLQCP